MGWGGGGVRSTKRYARKGKLNEKKIHARQLTLKNIHAKALKKFRNNENKFPRLENSPPTHPPITFLMVRP